MVKFNVQETNNYNLIEFVLDAPITPDVLKTVNPPKVNLTKPIIISGRGPIWLYGKLIHFYHTSVAIAVYDPRLNGAVIVETHHPNYNEGDIIPL